MGGHGLAAKSELEISAVVGVFDFRSCVASKASMASVAKPLCMAAGHCPDLGSANTFSARLNLMLMRVDPLQRVLQHSFTTRRRTLNHLAGSYLVGQSLGEDVNLAIKSMSVDNGHCPV